MLPLLALILISTFLVSAISLVGIVFLTLNEKWFRRVLIILVSFASGTLLGGAFFHLIPEAINESNESSQQLFIALSVGLLIFFLLEKSLWRHCHEREKCPVHPFSYLNLIGDGVHNFIDGIIIAMGFMASPLQGFVITLAVTAHEIPQEIGDFSILIYGGFSRAKAIGYNFLTALTAMLGALFAYFGASIIPPIPYMLMFAAGGFIYIATTDLMPELHKERSIKRSIIQFIVLTIGLFLMWFLTWLH